MSPEHREELTVRLTTKLRQVAQEFIMGEVVIAGAEHPDGATAVDVTTMILDALSRNYDTLNLVASVVLKRKAN